jgi:hypothetical protein
VPALRRSPNDRELRLSSSVDRRLTNVRYGNGVLVVAMPKASTVERAGATQIGLTAIEATRGEHVGHGGRAPQPMTTREHRCERARRVIRPAVGIERAYEAAARSDGDRALVLRRTARSDWRSAA